SAPTGLAPGRSTPSSIPGPTPLGRDLHSLDDRTGVAEIDAFLVDLSKSDRAAIERRVLMSTLNCPDPSPLNALCPANRSGSVAIFGSSAGCNAAYFYDLSTAVKLVNDSLFQRKWGVDFITRVRPQVPFGAVYEMT